MSAAIAVDGQGTMWFACTSGFGGLIKYDGTKWNIFQTYNSDLPSNRINRILIGNDGVKWIGTKYFGLVSYDGYNWTSYDLSNSGLKANEIRDIEIDDLGNKWLICKHELKPNVVRFDNDNWHFYHKSNSPLPNSDVNDIELDSKGNYWFIANEKGLIKYDKQEWTNYLSNSKIHGDRFSPKDIEISADNMKVIGTLSNGLTLFYKEAFSTYYFRNSDESMKAIHEVAIDDSSNIWIGSDRYRPGYHGLTMFDGKKLHKVSLTDTTMKRVNVMTISIDDRNNKWIGLAGAGLVKFNDEEQIRYTKQNSGLPGNNVYHISVAKGNTRWIGTNAGLARFKDTGWTVFNTRNSGLPGNKVYTIAVDNNNTKWIGTNAGLGRLK